jgi:hypothetical protein
MPSKYAVMKGAEESGALELRISKFEDDLCVPISILHLTRGTLQECIEAAAEARVHGGPDQTADGCQSNSDSLDAISDKHLLPRPR